MRQLVNALVQVHPEARYVVLSPFLDEVALPEVSFRGVRVPVPKPLSHSPLGKIYWEQVSVPRAARHLDVDLLHVPYWAPPMMCALPTVVTIFDLIPLLLPAYRGGIRVRLYTALVRAASPKAKLLLTDSESARQDIIRHLHVSPDRVRRTWLAVDPVFQPARSFQDIEHLQSLGLVPGYVLYLGGFDRRKNLTAVFQAFARVCQSHGGPRLVLAGKLPAYDSAFAPDPRRLMREAGVDESLVQCVGFVPEEVKPALYRGARTFVFPSLYEGFGLPPLEALACGVPVVASNVSSLPEVVGEGGVLVAPRDVDAMAEALARLLTDDVFHAEMRARAVRQAQRFSWTATAQATWAAYQEIA